MYGATVKELLHIWTITQSNNSMQETIENSLE